MEDNSAAGPSTGTYDSDDVAAIIKASTRHVRRLADGGRMPAPMHVGRLVRWNRQVIDTWIADGCKPVRTVTGRKAVTP